MSRRGLASRISQANGTPGIADLRYPTNPLLEAYDRYPTIRKIIDSSKHNGRVDVVHHRVTADVTERVIRALTT